MQLHVAAQLCGLILAVERQLLFLFLIEVSTALVHTAMQDLVPTSAGGTILQLRAGAIPTWEQTQSPAFQHQGCYRRDEKMEQKGSGWGNGKKEPGRVLLVI